MQDRKCDTLIINAGIDINLVNLIANTLRQNQKKSEELKLVLTTNGGDPHCAFKIARLLQKTYPKGYFQIIIDRCKSAGTLITCGATEIFFLNPEGELGPLDTQRIKNEDLSASAQSSLNIFKFLDYVSKESIRHFSNNFVQLRGAGLSVKSASEVCANMVHSIFEPLCKQIDPMQVGEMSRNLDISKTYMASLNIYNNLQMNAMDKLIYGYPDHNFVIDYYEAKTLFSKINEIVLTQEEIFALKNNKQFEFKSYETI